MVSNNGQCVCMPADVFMHMCVYECIYTAIYIHTYIFIYRYTSTLTYILQLTHLNLQLSLNKVNG